MKIAYFLSPPPFASFGFETAIRSPFDLYTADNYSSFQRSDGMSWNHSKGIGIGTSVADKSAISLSPSYGLDVGINYTWKWDEK